MSTEPVSRTPFVRTHRRKDMQVEAMLLSIRDGRALYRLRYEDGKQMVHRTTCTSERLFREKFQ